MYTYFYIYVFIYIYKYIYISLSDALRLIAAPIAPQRRAPAKAKEEAVGDAE